MSGWDLGWLTPGPDVSVGIIRGPYYQRGLVVVSNVSDDL